jgi:hypothetical protein
MDTHEADAAVLRCGAASLLFLLCACLHTIRVKKPLKRPAT